MKNVFSSIFCLATLAFAAAFLSQYTPHPNMIVLLGFSLVRSFFLQLQQIRLRKKLEDGEARHARLVSRIDRMEWEVIFGAFNRRAR